MPYAPDVNNRSGELLADGMNNASQIKLAGTQALASGVASAGSSIGSGIGTALSEFDKSMAKNKYNLGQLDALKSTNLLGPGELDELVKIKDPDKLAGALAIVGGVVQQRQQDNYLQSQQDSAQKLWDYKRRNPLPTTPNTPTPTPNNTYVAPPQVANGVNIW